MTADMAHLIGLALGTSAEMWVRLQAQYDLEVSEIKNPDLEVTQIVNAGQRVC